jgi:sulfur transfer complex TusBCD TusB component (DsrH family)
MDSNLDSATSISQGSTISVTALQYLQDLQAKSALRKISETKTVTVEDVVELTAAAQATLGSGDPAA